MLRWKSGISPLGHFCNTKTLMKLVAKNSLNDILVNQSRRGFKGYADSPLCCYTRDRFGDKRKAGLARRVTRQGGSTFCEGKLGHPPTRTYSLSVLHINTLAHPAGSTNSKRENYSMREFCWLGQGRRGQLFSDIRNARLSLLGVEGDPSALGNISLYHRV